MVHCADIWWAVIHNYPTCQNVLPKGCTSEVSKIFGTYFLSYQCDKLVKTVVKPSSSFPEVQLHQMQTSWRRISYTPNNQKIRPTATSTVFTRPVPSTDYISHVKNYTLTALLGHTDGTIEMHSQSATATMTMFAAATRSHAVWPEGIVKVTIPDSKVHGANVGPIWGLQDPGGPRVGYMNFVIGGAAVRSQLMPGYQSQQWNGTHSLPLRVGGARRISKYGAKHELCCLSTN